MFSPPENHCSTQVAATAWTMPIESSPDILASVSATGNDRESSRNRQAGI
jgi:hypothetical protein